MTNFWAFVLAAVDFFIRIVIVPLFGGANNYHTAIGLKNQLGTGAWLVLEIAWSALSVFDLRIPALTLAVFAPLWFIRLADNIYLFIKRQIPGA